MTNPKKSEWMKVRFGEVARNVNTTTKDPESLGLDRVVGLDHMDPESLPLRRWDELTNLNKGTSFTRIFRAGQVLFGKRRAYQKKVSVPDFDGICSGDILVFESSSDLLLPYFLPYIVQSAGFFEHALGTSAGSLSPRTKWQELAKYEFVLPPAEEQRRISEILSALDEVRFKYDSVPIRSAQQALLSSLLATHGSKHVHLKDVSTISYGYTESASPNPIGPKFLRITDIQDRGVDWDSVPFCKIDDATLHKQRLRDGDIVFARTGSVGKSFLVVNPPEAVCASYLIRVQADRAQVIPEYLFFNFGTPQYWAQVRSGSSGSVQDGFNATKLGELEIDLPSLDLQANIIDEMRKVETVESSVYEATHDLESLRRRILNELLMRVDFHV